MASSSRYETGRCEGCGNRTTASGVYCRSCQSKVHHAYKRIEREELLVDVAGGSWWVWTKSGGVLVIGKETKQKAVYALATGEEAEAA